MPFSDATISRKNSWQYLYKLFSIVLSSSPVPPLLRPAYHVYEWKIVWSALGCFAWRFYILIFPNFNFAIPAQAQVQSSTFKLDSTYYLLYPKHHIKSVRGSVGPIQCRLILMFHPNKVSVRFSYFIIIVKLFFNRIVWLILWDFDGNLALS